MTVGGHESAWLVTHLRQTPIVLLLDIWVDGFVRQIGEERLRAGGADKLFNVVGQKICDVAFS